MKRWHNFQASQGLQTFPQGSRRARCSPYLLHSLKAILGKKVLHGLIQMSVSYHKYVGDKEWEAFETPSSRQQVTQSHISDAQKGLTNQDLVTTKGTKTEFIRINNWVLYYTIQVSIIKVLILD